MSVETDDQYLSAAHRRSRIDFLFRRQLPDERAILCIEAINVTVMRSEHDLAIAHRRRAVDIRLGLEDPASHARHAVDRVKESHTTTEIDRIGSHERRPSKARRERTRLEVFR